MQTKSLLELLATAIVEWQSSKRLTINPQQHKQSYLRHWLPSRGNVLFTLLVAASLIGLNRAGALSLAAPAAAPTSSSNTIAYQGRIANASGQAITGTQPMTFRLYNAASGGTHLWEEQWTGPNSVRVSDGLFNVMLGSLSAISQAIITGNPNLWLGITVGADNEMSPRVQFGSVPFATQALTVPDGSVTTEKLADGSVTAAKLSNGSIPRLLGRKLCNNCGSGGFNETVSSGVYPVKGANVNDFIEVTVTTTGKPLVIQAQAFSSFVPNINAAFIRARITQENVFLGDWDIDGARYSPTSGAILNTMYFNGNSIIDHLPAGTYTFRLMLYVESATTINWAWLQQIAVYEY